MRSMLADPAIRFEQDFWFPASPSWMWDTIARFDDYPTWWRWLREFTPVPDAAGLTAGTTLLGTVAPPLPYRLALTIALDRCQPPRLIDATVDGDLRGTGALRLTPAGDGTVATVAWTLRFANPALRAAARVGYPVMRWAHDQVVSMAVAGFERRALGVPART